MRAVLLFLMLLAMPASAVTPEWLKLTRTMAAQGDAGAQYNLGFMYEKGQGVPQDYKEAVKWYRKAAEQGDASGQFMLGDMYWEGTGVPKDAPTAYMWTNIAAATGDKNFVIGREALTELMNPSQIEQGQELTRACVARNYKGC